MTVRFGSGDQYIGGPCLGDEATFRVREYFVDVLREEVPKACEHFRQRMEPTFREVFEAHHDQEALKALLKQKDLPWEWPPSGPKEEWSPYSKAFGGWPPPTPSGTLEMRLDYKFLQMLYTCDRCWRFHGWLLTSLLGDALDSWSREWHLEENPWVASHLLARACKARLFHGEEAQHDVKLDHLVFASPGVLAKFQDSLDQSFASFRNWDPTQEQWAGWWKAAGDPFRQALANYKARVLEEGGGRDLHPTPGKRKPERDFRRLVRFQVLGQTQQKVREKGEDIKAVQKALRRTAELVGLRLRTNPVSST